MTPQDRLKEIKRPYSYQGAEMDGDTEWLIKRVEQLEKALIEIAKDFGTDHCDGNTMIAEQVLEEMP